MKSWIHKFIVVFGLLWTGFVCAISFMEAWLKFKADGVTREIGLSIGRLVFSVLNKVELFFAIVMLILVIKLPRDPIYKKVGFYGAFCILLFQTVYLLPQLDERANQIINNGTVGHSNLHFVYVILECLKVFGLLYLTFKYLKANT
ncbi:hypothetical protein J0X14_15845 [Muricauda sp. CAU 1633]|uniref:hypothetical protein n=1 Tax=Allomuricauda sp. CAU 1633 TaxID=2816036 RepID=UPI001A8C1D11|nr:hypothetical protein [Muricauda sp. CAU 1633]MBO0323783.1 hypothetical protein [Muricauda sp. CAU 1633]